MNGPFFSKRRVTHWIWIGCVFFLFFHGTIGSAQEENDRERDRILSGLKDRFAQVRTFQADYVREIVPKVPSQLSSRAFRAEGKMYFRAPNRLRLDQSKPRKEILILNGEKAWWFVPEEKTVQVFSLKDYTSQIKPILNLLSGLKDVEKDFSVRLEGPPSSEVSSSLLVLIPKKPQPDLQKIRLQVAKKDFLPLEFTYENLLGDGTRFCFDRIRTGMALADSLFLFTPPKGTRVLE